MSRDLIILLKDEELWFNDEEDFDEEGSGPVLGPGGLGEPTKASCTSVSTTSPQVEEKNFQTNSCCALMLWFTQFVSKALSTGHSGSYSHTTLPGEAGNAQYC